MNSIVDQLVVSVGSSKKGAPPLVSGNLLIFGQQSWLVLFAVLMLVHALCYLLVRALPPSSRFATLQRDAHLAAHALPQFIGFALAAWCGAGDWFFDMPPASSVTIGSYLPQGERISSVILGFQIYELVTCIPSARLRGGAGELFGHHVVSILLSYLCYYHQAFHFYSPGFMGVAEISSLPLAVVDFFKHFPALRTHFSTTNELTRQVFAVLFLALRGVYWPICSLGFWRATLATFDAGAQAQAAVPAPIMYTFLVCNVLMTCLQWFWASLILKAIVHKLTGDPRHKEA